MSQSGLRRGLVAMTVFAAASAGVFVAAAPAANALSPVNPVRVDLNGHPANSGFLVFVEGNVALNADESEGTLAAGGNLSFNSTYNIAAHTPMNSTFTAPGDSGPTYLYVGGGMAWTGSQVLRVLNGGFTKIADSSTYTARNRDQNNAQVNYRVVKPGAAYDSTPRIEGTTNAQSPESVSTPVPSSLIDMAGAFTLYRQLTTQIGECPSNVVLTDPNGGSSPISQPYSSGARGRLTLTQGATNVLQMSTTDLANLSEITFVNQPSASTPLVVNVTGSSFNGNIPNLAGIGGSQAPYIIWNFPQATSIVVNGGASIEGTIYAPNAALNWRPTQNVEGNIIAKSFTHGPVVTRRGTPREIHDFPFATTISCASSQPKGTLTLGKNVVNTGGGSGVPSDWTLTADGPQTVTGPGNSPAVTGVSVDPGTYTLSESGGLPNYTAGHWVCAGGVRVGDTVVVLKNATVVCKVTNTYQPPPPPKGTLTLVKHVVNTGGGTAAPGDWTLTAAGPDTVTGPGNSASVTTVTVDTGDYDLSESGGPADYTAGSWSCTGGTLTGTTVTVATDADVTCEITNTYSPPPVPTGTLTLVKHVVNAGGGTAAPGDWTLSADGPTSFSGAGNSAAVTGVVVGTGDYDLSESGGPVDYTAGSWSCTGGSIAGSTVTVGNGENVTCDITNTYSPPPAPTGTLTLVKHVDGGLAIPRLWTLTADGPVTVTGPGNSAQVTAVVVPTGSYELSESGGPNHYAAGDWSCTGGMLAGTSVTVTTDADVTCEITNTFQPPTPPTGTLTLVKQVDNAGGGQGTPDQWTLTADGPQHVSGPGNSPQVTGVTVTTGDYALSESGGPADYTASTWSCTGGSLSGHAVTVGPQADVRCEITNTYSPPPSPEAGSITLIKHVDGGAATPADFTLTATGPDTVSGPGNSEAVSGQVVAVGDYSLSESGPDGYKAGAWTCTGGTQSGDRVTLAHNALVTCRITNTLAHARPTQTASSPSSSSSTSTGTSSGSGTLPFTGADIIRLLAVAVGLLALGGVMLAVARRCRTPHGD
jgi:choice-of-anchor A domain-containing protein